VTEPLGTYKEFLLEDNNGSNSHDDRRKFFKKFLIIKHLIDTCVSLLSENVEVNFDFHLLFVIIVKIDIENYNQK
jgi:hypothetical protein